MPSGSVSSSRMMANWPTDRAQQLLVARNSEGIPHNSGYFDPGHYQDCGYQGVLLDRSEARAESASGMEIVRDANNGTDGMIPVHEERPMAVNQRDAATQTGLGGDEKKFWANRKVDLALIPCMWVVFGTYPNLLPEFSSSHTVIRGCVTNATTLALQIVNYKVLLNVPLGSYLGVAVLIKGIAGLASSVTLLINPEESNFGGEIALVLLLAASDAVIGPCFVLLTGTWYANTNGGCIVRLLLWASSYPALFLTVDQALGAINSSFRVQDAMYAGLTTLCVIIPVYIFLCVDMPGMTMWLDSASAHRKHRLRDREMWRKHHRSIPLAKLIAMPTTWFLFGTAFFSAASIPLDGEVLQQFSRSPFSEKAIANFLVLLPIAAFGFLVVTYPITRGTFPSGLGITIYHTSSLSQAVATLHYEPFDFLLTTSTLRNAIVPVLVLTASLAFAGQMLLLANPYAGFVDDTGFTYFYFELSTGVLFLRNMRPYWRYLLWAIILLISSGKNAGDSSNLISNVVVASAAIALGRVLGYGVLPLLTTTGDQWFRSVQVMPAKVFISLMFALQTLVLLGWFAWLVWQRLLEGRQKEREGQRTPAVPDGAAELEC